MLTDYPESQCTHTTVGVKPDYDCHPVIGPFKVSVTAVVTRSGLRTANGGQDSIDAVDPVEDPLGNSRNGETTRGHQRRPR